MPLPETERGLVIRTDFSDQDAWEATRTLIEESLAEESAEHENLDADSLILFIDDDARDGLTIDDASDLVEESRTHRIVYLADDTTMTSDDHTLAAVMSRHEDGDFDWNFRLKPETVAQVQVRLATAPHVGKKVHEGVYRY